MGHETQVDVAPDEVIDWFAGYGPVAVGDECDHACAHRGTSVIAWGPSLTHYELVECTDCKCRAWESALPNSKGGIRGSHPYLKIVGAASTEQPGSAQ